MSISKPLCTYPSISSRGNSQLITSWVNVGLGEGSVCSWSEIDIDPKFHHNCGLM